MDKFQAAKSIPMQDVYNYYCGMPERMRREKGANVVTCPFHEDKTPSLYIYEDNHWHCYGCDSGRSTIDFVMKLFNLDNNSAAEKLCADFGVEHEESEKERKARALRQEDRSLLLLNRRLGLFFANQLEKSPNPRFFEDRGVGSLEGEYLLGYCPDVKIFKNVEGGLKSGLGLTDGTCVLKRRYVVPILDANEIPLAFIGRLPDELVDEENPKYVITKNTAVFRKRNMFFNLKGLKEAGDAVLIVEGVFDALSFVAAGVKNVVSTMGAHISEDQIDRLKMSKKTPVLAFDNDATGKAATVKAFSYLKGFRPEALTTDYRGCKDANEFLVKYGAKALAKETVSESAPEYLIRLSRESGELGTLQGQEKLWIDIAKAIGSNDARFADKYPVNQEYTPKALDYYWGLYDKATKKAKIKRP